MEIILRIIFFFLQIELRAVIMVDVHKYMVTNEIKYCVKYSQRLIHHIYRLFMCTLYTYSITYVPKIEFTYSVEYSQVLLQFFSSSSFFRIGVLGGPGSNPTRVPLLSSSLLFPPFPVYLH